jgi:hypothetical protein
MTKYYQFCQNKIWVSGLTNIFVFKVKFVLTVNLFKDSSTINGENPDFTECFQNTVLIWLPCFLVFLIGPLWVLVSLKKCSFKKTQFTKLFFLKLVKHFNRIKKFALK